MIISTHQPQYIPWIPYFSKINQSDIFVFLDDVQYQRRGLQNRNYILCKQGKTRLTIPVSEKYSETKINEVIIADSGIFNKHLLSLEHCYKHAKYYDEIMELLREIFAKQLSLLSQFNIEIIVSILNYLSIKTEIKKSSEIDKDGRKSEMILSICKILNAKIYLTGSGGLDYLNKSDFDREGIEIELLNYDLKPYVQHNSKEIVDGLSILDLLFNQGKESIKYI